MADDRRIIETQLVSLSRLANETDILLSRHGVSVRSRQGETVLTSGWRRWVSILGVLAFILLNILPFIITYFVIPETSPKRKEMMGSSIFLAVFSLLLLLLVLRGILRYGKISWRDSMSELTLRYGSLLFPKKIVMPREGLAVKMYIYKADKSLGRVKYGSVILSLTSSNQPGDELIIAAVKDKKFIEGAYRSLKDFLGQGIDETLAGEPVLPKDLPLLDIEGSGWNELVKKTRTKRPFFGSIRSGGISIKSCSEGVVFKQTGGKWLAVLFLLFFCGLFYFSAFYFFEMTIRGIFLCGAWLFAGTLFAFGIIGAVAADEKAILNNWISTINLRCGIPPFAKTYTISAGRLKARIYRCDISQTNKVIKPGYILLSLYDKYLDSEVILAAASKKSLIMPAYERLAEFLRQPQSDELLEEVELSNGQKIKVSKDSLTGGGGSEDIKRAFRIISDDTAVFSAGWFGVAASSFLAVIFIAVTISALFGEDDGTELAEILVLTTLSLAFIVFGAGFAIYSWLIRHIVIEKSDNRILRRAFVKSRGKGKLLCAISDIAAVQACSILGMIMSGNTQKEATIFETNLVLKDSDDKRINITAGQNTKQIKEDAIRFASFLGVPFIDHT